MKILIISFFFAPVNKIGAVRVSKTAKYLERFGHDVRVLTDSCTMSDDNSLPVEINTRNIYYTDYKPIDLYLTNKYKSFSKFKKLFFRLYIAIKHKNIFYLLSDEYFAWVRFAVGSAKDMFCYWKPDLIISSSLPFASHVVGSKISREYSLKWIADCRDLWSGGVGARLGPISSILYPLIEKYYLKNASLITTVSEPLSDVLKKNLNKKSLVIYNGYDTYKFSSDELNEIELIKKNNERLLVINYMGSLYEGRDPTLLLEVVKNNKYLKDHVVINFYSYNNEYLKEKILCYVNLINVNILKPVTFNKSQVIQKISDILLYVSYNSNQHNSIGVLSGKAFEYLNSDRPILSIGKNSYHPLIDDSLMQHFSGYKEIENYLCEKLDQKLDNKFISETKSSLKHRWSREYQTNKLNKEINKLCEQ